MEAATLKALRPLADLLTREKNRVARAVEFRFKKRFEKTTKPNTKIQQLESDLKNANTKVLSLEDSVLALQRKILEDFVPRQLFQQSITLSKQLRAQLTTASEKSSQYVKINCEPSNISSEKTQPTEKPVLPPVSPPSQQSYPAVGAGTPQQDTGPVLAQPAFLPTSTSPQVKHLRKLVLKLRSNLECSLNEYESRSEETKWHYKTKIHKYKEKNACLALEFENSQKTLRQALMFIPTNRWMEFEQITMQEPPPIYSQLIPPLNRPPPHQPTHQNSDDEFSHLGSDPPDGSGDDEDWSNW